MNEIIISVLLGLLVLFALLTVVMRNLLKAVICLAATSAVLTAIMFMLSSPLAAVFELSVCAGLITVIFISVISLAKPVITDEEAPRIKERTRRYIFLPIILLVVVLSLVYFKPAFNYIISSSGIIDTNVQDAIWNKRMLDMLGQIIIILAGVLAVVILFKENNKK